LKADASVPIVASQTLDGEVIKEPLAANGNPLSGKRPSPTERLETVRFSNAETPSSRSRREYATNIQHIVGALLAAGYTTLDAQATALGIHRATAWTMIRKKHKLNRLNTNTINRMLTNPDLPPRVRAVIEQYVTERPVLGRRPKMGTLETSENKEHRIYEGGAQCEEPERRAGRKAGRLQNSKRYAKR
jgi:hypothetical protein